MTCTVFPARPSADGCSLCTHGTGGCQLANALAVSPSRRGLRAPWRLPARQLQLARLVRGILCAAPLLAVGGLIEGDYVGATKGMSLLVPGLVGLACTAAVSRGARPVGGPVPIVAGAVLGALAALVGFWSAQEPYGPVGRWLPPTLCGLVGAFAWAWYDNPAPARRITGRG